MAVFNFNYVQKWPKIAKNSKFSAISDLAGLFLHMEYKISNLERENLQISYFMKNFEKLLEQPQIGMRSAKK